MSAALRCSPRVLTTALLVIVILAGCGDAPDVSGEDAASVRDSAGIEIVFSDRPRWDGTQGWAVDTVPAFVLGPEVGEEHVLYRVGSIERLDDGRLVVENRDARELLVFDSAGAFLEAWGGEGEGPDEFGFTRGLFRCGKGTGIRLLVVDYAQAVFLDERGRRLESIRLPPDLVGAQRRVYGAGGDCGWLLTSTLLREAAPTGLGTYSYLEDGVVGSLRPPDVRKLGTFRGSEWMPDAAGRPAFLMPFAYTPGWWAAGRWVYYGWGDRPEVTVLSAKGDTVRLIRWNAPPDSITERDWRTYQAERQEDIAANPRTGEFNLSREAHPRPYLKPYFGPRDLQSSPFRVDDRGRLWVRSFTRIRLHDEADPSPPLRWRVFDPDGRWLTTVRTPANFEVHSIRDGLLLGVARDAFGQEQVVGYRLRE